MVQIARTSRNAIDMFTVPVDRLLESISDLNGNNNYVPKEDVIGEWTAIPTKTERRYFRLAIYLQAGNKARPTIRMGVDEEVGDRVHRGTRRLCYVGYAKQGRCWLFLVAYM